MNAPSSEFSDGALAAIGPAFGASSGLLTLLHFVEVPPGDMDWLHFVGVAIDSSEASRC